MDRNLKDIPNYFPVPPHVSRIEKKNNFFFGDHELVCKSFTGVKLWIVVLVSFTGGVDSIIFLFLKEVLPIYLSSRFSKKKGNIRYCRGKFERIAKCLFLVIITKRWWRAKVLLICYTHSTKRLYIATFSSQAKRLYVHTITDL